MKNIKFAIVALFAALCLPSCIRFVPQGQQMAVRPYVENPQGFQQGLNRMVQQGQGSQNIGNKQGQRGVRKLDSITVTKRQTGYCQARIWQGPENTPTNVQMVSNYATSVYEKTGRVPSEQVLSNKFGFKTQARWIDTPDRIVGKVTVRPDEVPASIRARFQ